MSFLEIDRSRFERSLLLNGSQDVEGDEINALIENYVNEKQNVPTKLVTPTPGFCLKTFTKDGEKVFMNICHTEDIPPPTGLRIPMSIGIAKAVEDRNGKSCVAIDVAVNSTFYNKLIAQGEIFIMSIIEAVAEKHNLDLTAEKFIILKNLKSKGKIQQMNIEVRPVKEDVSKKALITEIETKKNDSDNACGKKAKAVAPDFNLIKIDTPDEYYASEVDLKNVVSKEEISLQIGEDRIFLTTSGKAKYELEYHLPETVNVDSCTAEFDIDEQILTIIAPVRK